MGSPHKEILFSPHQISKNLLHLQTATDTISSNCHNHVNNATEFNNILKIIQSDIKKRELLKNPTKIEEIQEKKNLLTEIEPLQLAF
jgi:hypothetical protein